MGNLFAEEKSLKEIIREQKHTIDRALRGLERERASLERDEKKLIAEIKTAAKKNQMKPVRIMAKDLVRIRKFQTKFVNMTAQLRDVSLTMTSMSSTQALTDSMKKAARSMMALNRQMNLPALQKIMAEFSKQSEMMDMKQEMVSDSMEDALDDEDEKESEEVVNQVLDEIGIDLTSNLVDAPSEKSKTEKTTEKVEKKVEKHEQKQ
eukprot:TRINITY_DN11670_c0_g1_i1.p1 TRINITY_DN11670_c0_g1~~TRINITY_DN11670_c0_g1_i1.p1  ORF type:complete len:207 (-),score=59.00 TRINITY_DN11670_c0_g1_i1:443-1063(-)